MSGTGNPNNIMQQVMMSGNIPVAGPGRTGMMGGGGGVIPPALLEESRVPRFYHDAILACGATTSTMLPHTALVYNLMVTSGLPRPVLSYVWSAVNRTLPGQLTRPEFFSCLALIALAQKGESLAALSSLAQLPIPFLQAAQIPGQAQAPVVDTSSSSTPRNTPVQQPTAPSSSSSNKQHSSAAFTPTSLLNNLGTRKGKSDMDLLGDVFASNAKNSSSSPASSAKETATSSLSRSSVSTAPTSTSSTVTSQSEVSKPNYDLSDIDWSSPSTFDSAATLPPCVSKDDASIKGAPLSVPTDSSSTGLPRASSEPCSNGGVVHTSYSNANKNGQLDCWNSIICAAADIFAECDQLSKSSSLDVLAEVFSSERGSGYIKSLWHLHQVVSRVLLTAGGSLSATAMRAAEQCERAWERMERFADPSDEECISEVGITNTVCAICCQPAVHSVDFAGRSYHPDCANLWLNNVRPLLPSLIM